MESKFKTGDIVKHRSFPIIHGRVMYIIKHTNGFLIRLRESASKTIYTYNEEDLILVRSAPMQPAKPKHKLTTIFA